MLQPNEALGTAVGVAVVGTFGGMFGGVYVMDCTMRKVC